MWLDNPISLNLNFEKISKNKVEAEFVPGEYHQGYDGIMNGGLTSTLLDEAMAYAVGFKDILAFTAELNVRFKKAVKIGEKLIIRGFYDHAKQSSIAVIHYTSAEIVNSSGELKAKAEAKFIEAD